FMMLPPTTALDPLSLHDALPILAWDIGLFASAEFGFVALPPQYTTGSSIMPNKRNPDVVELMRGTYASVAAARTEIEQLLSLPRSEEHTSELQSRENLVCRLLLE